MTTVPFADGETQKAITHRLGHLGDRVRVNAPLAGYTTFGVGGPALVLVEAHSEVEVMETVAAAHAANKPIVAVGQGSNLLIADSGVDAIVIVLAGDFAAITRHESDPRIVTAGAAVKLPVLARQSVSMGLTGLEWAVGVPGSVGGGVRMNAGGHGSDIAANFVSAVVVNTDESGSSTRERSDLEFGYRTSSIRDCDVVLNATFQLEVLGNSDSTGDVELKEIVRWRREHQPGGANCGSVFTNPPGDSAGRLIDAAGLKGYRIGTAQVSPKHANFIQADPGATARDISALIVYVQTVVFEQFHIHLHAEVKTLGLSSFQRVS
jgi:UDP-N-acetylmuramate dehydrogenase